MGSTHLLILSLFPSTLPFNPSISSFHSLSSSSSSFPSSPFPRPVNDPLRSTRFGSDHQFGFCRRKKRRNWWDDDDDEDDDDEFGFWIEPISNNWIFEVLRSFGWIVPALLVRMLMGNEDDNSWLMALALPLGQTALSLVMDKLWGDPTSNLDSRSRPRPRSRSKPRARSRTKSSARSKKNPFDWYTNEKPRESRRGAHSMRGNFESWEAADNTSSGSEGRKGGSSFRGWDE